VVPVLAAGLAAVFVLPDGGCPAAGKTASAMNAVIEPTNIQLRRARYVMAAPSHEDQ
jgi:hypothetical protein